MLTYYNDVWNDSNIYTLPTCTTDSSTAVKYAFCNYYNLTPNTYTQVIMHYDNAVQDAITLNINGTGDKPIYINGEVSSALNYTLPKGSYITFYDGEKYHFRTDGKIPGSVSGTADNIKIRTWEETD